MLCRKIISVVFSFVLLVLFASTVKAQVTGGVIDLTTLGQGILPDSGNIEIFGIDLNDGGGTTKLASITVTFNNVLGFSMTDIDRVAVYSDNQGAGSAYNGIFSNGDVLIGEELNPASSTVTIDCNNEDIPDITVAPYVGDDFFVVINTSDTISGYIYYENAFTITIGADAIVVNPDTDNPTITATTTPTITCEAWADDFTPISEAYFYIDDYQYPGNGWSDPSRYRYSVPDEWIRPRYDVVPVGYEEVYPTHWPLSQLLPMETASTVLGFACAGGTTNNPAYLESVTVTFTDLAGADGDFDPTTGLDTLRGTSSYSGVALYRDDDSLVWVSYGAWVDVGGGVWTLTLTPTTLGGEAIDLAANGAFDYYIVLRADSGYTDDSGYVSDGCGIGGGEGCPPGGHHGFGSTFTATIETTNVEFSDRPAEDGADPGLSNNPSQPYVTAVKEIHPVLKINNMVSNLYYPRRIDATSPATPIFGINITDTMDSRVNQFNAGEVFDWVTVHLHDVGGTTDTSDFASLSADDTSGLSLWMDNKTAGDIGVFDSQDTFIQIQNPHWEQLGVNEWAANLNTVTAQEVHGEDVYTTDNRGDDYFVCVRTSDILSYNNRFYFEIEDAGVKLAHQTSAVGSGITTDNLTANFPVFLTDLTSSGQRIPPLSSPTPVIGINTWDDTGNVGKLQQVIVEFYNAEGADDMYFDPPYDLLDLTLDSGSGVTIYQDSAWGTPGGIDGVFDSTDIVIPLSSATWVGVSGEVYFQCKLVLAPPLPIPANDTALGNRGADYFIVIRTNDESTYEFGDDFSVGIVSWGPEGSVWGSRALGFIDKNSIQTRSYERIKTNVVGHYAEPPVPPEPEEPGSLGGGGLGCFIATACYETPMAEEVRVLSEFRDDYLLTNSLGKIFVGSYYKFSPHLAEYISERPLLKKFVRIGLEPLVWFSEIFVENCNGGKQ